MNKILKRHWRIIIPILAMLAITLLMIPAYYPDIVNISIIALLLITGASWYYYLRNLSIFTPAFTFFASILPVPILIFLITFPSRLLTNPNLLLLEISLSTLTALVGTTAFAIFYYLTRTKSQKQARRRKITHIWRKNKEFINKLKGNHKK